MTANTEATETPSGLPNGPTPAEMDGYWRKLDAANGDQTDRNERDVRAALDTIRLTRCDAGLLMPGDVILIPSDIGDQGPRGDYTRHTVISQTRSKRPEERDGWVEVVTDLTTYRCSARNKSALVIRSAALR